MKPELLDESVRNRIAEIHKILGHDGYYKLHDNMDFTEIMGLSGDPRYHVSDEIGEAAVYEWPLDLSIQELAIAEAKVPARTPDDELPDAIWAAYQRLIEKSQAAVSSRAK